MNMNRKTGFWVLIVKGGGVDCSKCKKRAIGYNRAEALEKLFFSTVFHLCY